MITRLDIIHKRDRHTDRQTARHRMRAKAALAYHCTAIILVNTRILALPRKKLSHRELGLQQSVHLESIP